MAVFNSFKTVILILLFSCFISCAGNKENVDEEEKIILSDESEVNPVEKAGELSGGAKIYSDNCKVCHGPDGKKQLAGAKDLSISTLTLEQRIEQIANGKTSGKAVMPGYKAFLTEAQIKEVALYLDVLKK